jgi:poly(hydroxyalkanoate) granule-associated protein
MFSPEAINPPTIQEANMVKKLQKISSKQTTGTANPLASAVKDSAQQIWLAGLGAFAKAQQEGTKAFEGLVKEGLSIQRKTQAVAEERVSEATNRMASMANDITAKASGQWDKLETIFEDRVARALNKLGVPSSQDIDALIARIDALNASMQKLQPKASKAEPVAPKAAAKAPARKATKAAPKATAKAATEVAVKPAAKTSRKAAAKPAKAITAPAAATPVAAA